jgi:hypothetical protein
MRLSMRNAIFGILVAGLLSASASASDAKNKDTVADLDCDGQMDHAHLEIDKAKGVVTVVANLSFEHTEQRIQFGLDNPKIESVCSITPELGTAGPDLMQLTMGYGSIPDGYWVTSKCKELVLLGGECDAIHIS